MTCDWCGVSSVARTTGFEVEDLLDPEMEKKRQSFEETVKRKVKDRPDGYAVKLEKWSSELSDKPVPKSEGEKLKMQTDTSTRSWSACWIHTSGRRHYNEQQWLRKMEQPGLRGLGLSVSGGSSSFPEGPYVLP